MEKFLIQDLLFNSKLWDSRDNTRAEGNIIMNSYGVEGSPNWLEHKDDPAGCLTLRMDKSKFYSILDTEEYGYDVNTKESLVDSIKEVLEDYADEIEDVYGAQGFIAYMTCASVVIDESHITIHIEHGDYRDDYDIDEAYRDAKHNEMCDALGI